MTKNIKYILIILLVFSGINPLFSQNTNKNTQNNKIIVDSSAIRQTLINSEGTEFYLCFMKNYKEQDKPDNQIDLELFISSDKDANVNIEIDGLLYKTKEFVPAKTVINIKFPPELQIHSSEQIERLAVHVTSDNPISVYGLNHRYLTTDTYLGLPVTALGMRYRVLCYSNSDGLVSEFAVVATEDNTEIKIVPTVNTTGHPGHIPYTVKLKKGDAYQVIALNQGGSKCDLTGSTIESNKKISVFSGHECTYVPENVHACNHIVEQLPPTPSWGRHYFIGKFMMRPKYSYRVLANESNTKVFEDNTLVKTLGAGEFYENIARKNIQLTSDKPVLVAQYSQGYESGDSVGDPMMILVSPTQQFLKHYRFSTPINGFWEHFINVIVLTRAIDSLKLDGTTVDPNTAHFEQIGLSRYTIGFINIPFGTHTMECNMPFGMYSYGFGYLRDKYDAYGNMGGQNFIEHTTSIDTLPPMVEAKFIPNKEYLIVRDDRVDDGGIREVKVLKSNNIKLEIPKFDQAVPQLAVNVKLSQKQEYGSIVFETVDMVYNSSTWTICYAFNQATEKFEYFLNEGEIKKCEPPPAYEVGIYGRISDIFHSADFSSSGNVISKGKFSDATGVGGYFGILIGQRINQQFSVNARLSIENYGGTLSSPDSTSTNIRTRNGDFVKLQEERDLTLNGLNLHLNLTGEWYSKKYFYMLGGLNFGFNLSNSITYERKIVSPNDYTYINGSQTITDESTTSLNSLRSIGFGMFLGAGITYRLSTKYSAFIEAVYSHQFSSLINDGDWTINQISFQFGIRMRLTNGFHFEF